MTTEKMRVSASSIMRSVPDVQPTAIRSRRAGARSPGADIADECTIGELPGSKLVGGRRALPIRGAFASLALLWPAAMVMATRIAAVPDRGAAAYLLSAAVYVSGSLLCHQRPERSFYLWGAQFPVCARCTGIYLGAALGVLAVLVRLNDTIRLKPDTTSYVASGFSRTNFTASDVRRIARLALFAASLPTALTLAYEWTTGITPANWIRALSGLVVGAAAAIVVMRAGAAPGREVN
jgi:hypothetical protein